MKILELFAGIGTFSYCIEQMGFKAEHIFVERDKFCQLVLKNKFPNAQVYDDVRTFDGTKFNDIDIVVFGSSCQDLSAMNKNSKGLAGEKSGLFWEAVRILKETKPKYFLMENVASMKNSERLTISKALGVDAVLLDSSKLGSAQKRCRYFWSNLSIQPPTGTIAETTFQSILENGFVKEKFAHTLITNHICETLSGLERGLGLSSFGKVGQIVYKNRGVATMEPKQIVEYYKQNATTGTKQNPTDFKNGVFRNITPIEAERLQGLPDNYTNVSGNSLTQRYKQLGNGFNCAHINYILEQNRELLNNL